MKPATHLPIATPNPLRIEGGGAWSLTSAARCLAIIRSAIAQRQRLVRRGESGLRHQDIERPVRELEQWLSTNPKPENIGHATITAFLNGPLKGHLRTLLPSTAAGAALFAEFETLTNL